VHFVAAGWRRQAVHSRARDRRFDSSMTARRLPQMSAPRHSLKSSLIPVFARVCASTVFTITAQ
jgi:transposase InsO family protein